MIELKTKIHDRYSIEIKMGFVADGKREHNDFKVGMWFFVPAALDINSNAFTKNEFYRCVKSNVRLITPHFRLEDVASADSVVFRNVTEAPAEDLEYRIKMLCAIVKSSLRDTLSELDACPEAERTLKIDLFVNRCEFILDRFFALPDSSIKEYCGEYLCNLLASNLFKTLRFDTDGEKIKELIRKINRTRIRHGYPVISEDDPNANRDFVHRQSVLKKMVDSELYLKVPKKKDGVIMEQASYSLAAGLAMLFATVVAWAFQRHFGNLTWPLFIALIISYMMKDRIKELMRFYFAHRLSYKYYDHKAKMSIHGREIGWHKEGMDFIAINDVPEAIKKHRNTTHLFDAEDNFINETVILYRKNVHLDKGSLEKSSLYDFEGVNDIVRLQVRPFIRKMDNPYQTLMTLAENGKVKAVKCAKDYFINIILQYQYADTIDYRRFRLTLNSEGIKAIDPVD